MLRTCRYCGGPLPRQNKRYCSSQCAGADRAQAIRDGILDARHYYDPTAVSPRELEVMSLAAAGLRNDEIADRLVLSERTVRTHISNIYKKLGVTNRVQAINMLRQMQALNGDPAPEMTVEMALYACRSALNQLAQLIQRQAPKEPV